MEGNIEVKQENIPISTLDESVMATFKRDFDVILGKVKIVFFGNTTDPNIQKHINDWDLWGPMLVGLLYAQIVSLLGGNKENSRAFTALIVLQWVGAAAAACNTYLLGYHISYFQMASALGYSLVPFFIRILIGMFPKSLFNYLVDIMCIFWGCRSASLLLSRVVDNRRWLLVLIPIVLYFVAYCLIIEYYS